MYLPHRIEHSTGSGELTLRGAHRFCAGLGGQTAEFMGDVLAFEADRRAINITVNRCHPLSLSLSRLLTLNIAVNSLGTELVPPSPSLTRSHSLSLSFPLSLSLLLTLTIAVNSLGTELARDDRRKLFSDFGLLFPQGQQALAACDDNDQVATAARMPRRRYYSTHCTDPHVGGVSGAGRARAVPGVLRHH
jgi:hypothetical protein